MLVGTRSRKFIEFKELRYRYAALFEPWYWVNCGVAVWVDLKVQVGSGGEAKVAHACNLLASVNSLANGNIKSFHVSVNRDGSVVVLDADPVAESRCRTGVDDDTDHGCEDWGALRIGNVGAPQERDPASS